MTPSLPATPADRAVVITGMHRSGTSLLASLFAGAGVNVGARLIGASRGNDRGHWEDLDFYDFHARALGANGLAPEGFACADEVRVPVDMRDEAAALVAAKAAPGTTWGWKDPRTSLFLDFWHGLLPEAVYVFVFRSPWEVADSLFRRGDGIFARHPALAVRVWLHYNRRIVDFCLAHRARCVLTEVTQLAVDPAAVFDEVRERLGVPVGGPPARFEEPLLVRDDGRRRREIIAALEPEAATLYAEMRRLAGCTDSSPAVQPRRDGGTIAEHALVEWSRAAAAEVSVRRLVASEAESLAAVRRTQADAAAAIQDAESRAAAQLAELDCQKRAMEGRGRELRALAEELSAQIQRMALGHPGVEAEGRCAA